MLQEDSFSSSDPSSSISDSSRDLEVPDTVETLEGNSRSYSAVSNEFPDRFRLCRESSANFHPVKTCSDEGNSFESTNRAYRIHIEPRILKDPREPRKNSCHNENPNYLHGTNDIVVFVGPESIWSFLQSIRLAVDHGDHTTDERIASFTEDGDRFTMEEPLSPEIPPDAAIPSRLPAFEKRQDLAHVFFTKVFKISILSPDY